MQKQLKKGFKYYRLGYTLFAFVSLVPILYYQISLPTIRMFTPGLVVLLFGCLIAAAGLVLMLICIKKYFISLSGLLSLVQDNSTNQLIIRGVHRYVRHPLYLGTFAMLWGLLLLMPYLSLLIAITIITGYTLFGIKLEETKLVEEFGESYVSYQRQVPMIIPRLQPRQ
jgi:protein-S-isoprenylcysteine O-methyltransferase Ste14